jgi:hypothetical protein
MTLLLDIQRFLRTTLHFLEELSEKHQVLVWVRKKSKIRHVESLSDSSTLRKNERRKMTS